LPSYVRIEEHEAGGVNTVVETGGDMAIDEYLNAII
jgi:hypothetical protein